MKKEYVRRSYRRQRERAIKYLGGKCRLCGYDKCIAALQFHHRDPATKEFTISGRTIKWDRLKPELDKCDLLCANCHAELHFEEIDSVLKVKRLKQKQCAVCKSAFMPSNSKQKCCSRICGRLSQRRISNRPTPEKLKELIATSSYAAVGRTYNVSDNTIRKWARG